MVKKGNKSVANPIWVDQQFKAMPVARLGGGNNFALYWLNLVTLGTIRFWWKFRLISLDPILSLNLFLRGFCSLMSVF